MALTVLLEARPMRAADAAPVVVRLAGLGSRPYTHAGVNDWWAGLTDAPRFSTALAFGQSGWTGGAVPTTGAIAFAPSDRSRIDALAALVWDDAAVTIWTGDDAAADPVWTVALDGVVAGIATRDGVLTITVADLSKKLARPIAADRFTGKGGIEGGSDAAERLKRRSFGRCWGVEARLLDKAANIYEVGDPARPMQAIDAVKDRGRAASAIVVVAWAGSIVATLDALKASAVPQGGAAVAPSIACVKWWTQLPDPLTVDLRGEIGAGYVETVAEIAGRIADGAGLPTLNVAAANAIRPGAAGLHVDSDSETAAQALDRLLLRASLLWLLEPAGAIRLLPIGFDPAGPIVEAIDASREASYKPVTRVVLGYQRNHRPHNAGEISAVFQASDGTYADGTPIEELKPATRGADVTSANTAAGIFGQGAFATQSRLDLDNGSFFTQPGRFQSYPGNANFFGAWKIAFGDGAGLDALQPGESNANRTEGRVAAGLLGQSAWATFAGLVPSIVAGQVRGINTDGNIAASWIYDPIANLGALSNVFPGERGANVTEWRTASAITGQGALATRNAASWLTQVIGRPMNVGNLVLRPSFADGTRGEWGTPGATTVVDVAGQSFAKAGRSTLRDTLEGGNVIPVAVGETLYFDVWLNSEESAVTVRAGLFAFDKAGRAIGFPTPAALPPRSGWTRLTGRYVVEPTVVAVQPFIQCDYDGSGSNAVKWAEYQLTRAQLGATVGGRLGTDILREGGGLATDAALVTALGVASAILGQGPFATRADGLINSTEVIKQGDAFLSQRWPEEGGSNRTEGRVAAAFVGQGALATRSSVSYGAGTSGGITDLPYGLGDLIHGGYLNAGRMAWAAGNTVEAFKPGEPNANVTEGRVAAAFAGQGALATQNVVAYRSQVTGADKPVTYILCARGNAAAPPAGYIHGLSHGDGTYIANGYERSYTVCTFDRGSGQWAARAFDVYGNGEVQYAGGGASANNAAAMAAYLNAIPNGVPVVVFTADEPFNLRLTGGLDAAMYRCGASAGVFGSANWRVHSAYTLVGIAGIGAGNGVEQYADGNGEHTSPRSWIITRFVMVGGVPQLGGKSPNDARDLRFEDGRILQDLGSVEGGADVTSRRTAAAIVGQGVLATRSSVSYGAGTSGGITDLPYGLGDLIHGGYLNAGRMAWAAGNTVEAFKPGEPNANVTEGRTAAAIAGQGALATTNTIHHDGQLDGQMRYRLAPSPIDGNYLGAGRIAWDQGDTVQNWKPGEAGANRTETRTAAAIAGQGALATQSGVSYRTQIADLPVALTQGQGLGIRADGTADPFFATWNDGVRVSDRQPGEANANRTEGRTAAAIAGQGALATANTIGGDGQLSGPIANRIAPSPVDGNFLGAGRIAWDQGDTVQNWKPGEAGANRTEGRIAAAVAGQGSLATRNGFGLSEVGDPWAGYVRYDNGASGTSVQSLRPEEAGGNRTEGRTASAIVGQGAFATAPQIGSWNVASYYNFSAFSLNYSITRSDGVSIVTETLAITQLGIAAAFAGQGALATKSQAGAADLAPGSAQRIAYAVLQHTISCGVGN